ncbi:MAG: GldG family protein [Planctomycetes bacterium]|nr:GldG family protein [Planctomycetota bacterium]
MTAPAPAAWSAQRRAGVATNVAIQLACLLAVLIGLNWISSRRYARWDLTAQAEYSLGDKTRQLLGRIGEGEAKYQVVVFYAPDEYGAWEAALRKTKDILEEYRTNSHGRIEYEVLSLYTGGREAVMDAVKRHKIRTEQFSPNDVLFKKGDTERIVNLSEFFQQDWSSAPQGQPPKLTAFNGEQIITSTLQALSQEKPIVIGFTAGHEESSPAKAGGEGYSIFARQILEKREGYEIRQIQIGGPEGVPKGVDLVLVAGPLRDFTESDVRNLKLYLNAGGRALFLLDAYPDRDGRKLVILNAFLAEWGIIAGHDLVIADADSALAVEIPGEGGTSLRTKDPTMFRPAKYENRHLITSKFDSDKEIHFVGACSVLIDPKQAPEGIKTTVLVYTNADTFATPLFPQVKTFVAGKCMDGPFGLAAAAEGKIKGNAGPETRIVVIGDSTALCDGIWGMKVARPDLVLNSIRWLANQEYIIGVDPKTPEDRSLVLTDSEDGYVFRVAVFFLPLIAIAFGGTMWLTRRSQ